MGRNVLVAYASKHGSTAEIAAWIGATLRQKGMVVDVMPAQNVRNVAAYDSVVLGSAVYIGLWRRQAVKFLKENVKCLSELPVWLFICGPTGEGDPVELTDGWFYPESLRPVVERIKPRGVTCFGGKMELNRLNLFEKFIVNKVNAPAGDFRNREAVVKWADGLV